MFFLDKNPMLSFQGVICSQCFLHSPDIFKSGKDFLR